VAFAGDWHANGLWAEAAIRYASELGAEQILQLGDFGYDFEPEYLDLLDRTLTELDLRLWFVDGNHENFDVLYRAPVGPYGRRELRSRIDHLPRGYRWTWDGVGFLAAGGAYSIDREFRELGDSYWLEEEITDADVAACANGGGTEVMVCHDCPSGVAIPGLEETARFWPPEQLTRAAAHRDRLRAIAEAVRPRLIWHGHYHLAYATTAELGYGPVAVCGLDCDETRLEDNLVVIEIAALARR
jgi:predicted phosphodiesterase